MGLGGEYGGERCGLGVSIGADSKLDKYIITRGELKTGSVDSLYQG